MGCGCNGAATGQAPPPEARARRIVHPDHRWNGGQVVYEGAVGPELDAQRRTAAQHLTAARSSAVAQALNGLRSRIFRGDPGRLPAPLPTYQGLEDIEADGPGIEQGKPTTGSRPPIGWWLTWGDTLAPGEGL